MVTSQVKAPIESPVRDPLEPGGRLRTRAGSVVLALYLVPFAGIAFPWFIGVRRDRPARARPLLRYRLSLQTLRPGARQVLLDETQ
jgi:hypothetical protein